MTVEEHTIPQIIDEIEQALLARDAIHMRELSNEASNRAAVGQDREVIDLAVASYALNKILSKVHYQAEVEELYRGIKADFDAERIPVVIEKIKAFDREHGFFQGDLIEKARIKIGTRLYSRGLSLTHSANLVGVTGSEILTFSGKTRVHEEADTKDVAERLDVARKLFR